MSDTSFISISTGSATGNPSSERCVWGRKTHVLTRGTSQAQDSAFANIRKGEC